MDEALDHGLDRLPFIFSALLGALFSFSAFATTFGPINVTEQIRQSQYFVHGKVTSAPWVEMERKVQRPYTHWRVQVLEQAVGASVGGEIIVREAGGELGGLGYHVAGSAKFREGEEVFVTVKDTEESNVKDIVGLASGKYSVEAGADGQPLVKSGLGIPVRDASGKPMSPREFQRFAERVARGQERESERNILLNNKPVHDHDPVLEKMTAEARQATPAASPPPPAPSPAKDAVPATIPVQQGSENTEEPNKGFGYWWIAAGMTLMALVVFFLRR